jgi:hypothetical protein
MFSPTQIISASGFVQGKGLGVSSNLISQLNTVESTENLTGKLRDIVKNSRTSGDVVTAMRGNIPGLSLTVPADYPTSLPGAIISTDVTTSIRNRADAIMSNGVKGFLGAFNTAGAVGGMTSNLLGSIEGFKTGFAGMAPGVKSFTDQLTGGLTSKFGPGALGSVAALDVSGIASIASSAGPAAIAQSLGAVSSALKGMGSLFNTKNPASIGDPKALVKNLNAQGLLTSTNIGAQLANNGVDVADIDNQNPELIIATLRQSSKADLDKIIADCKVVVPPGAPLNSAADLLSAEKLLGPTVAKSIPGGSLTGLSEQLVSVGGNGTDALELAENMAKVEIPNFPALDALDSPVPEADIAALKEALPKGSGTFGNPKVQDMLGTAAGHVHTGELINIINAASSVVSTDAGVTLLFAVDAYLEELANPSIEPTDPEGEYTVDPDKGQEVIDAINALVDDVGASSHVTSSNESVNKMIAQLVLELENCDKGGIDPSIEPPGIMGQLGTALKLPSLGIDKQDLGTGSMLAAMATDDKYGQALQASMMEGKTSGLLEKIGLPKVGAVDVSALSAKMKSLKGEGLTQAQKENIIADAKAKNLPEDQALSNASLFGYNSKYFEDLGYPPV